MTPRVAAVAAVLSLTLALAGRENALAVCACEPNEPPNFPRVVLLAHAGEYEATLAAANLTGADAGLLRRIAKLFRQTEKQMRLGLLARARRSIAAADRRLAAGSAAVQQPVENVHLRSTASFPRKRESSLFARFLDPRFRGGDVH